MTFKMPDINLASLPGPDTIAHRVFPNGVVGLAYENSYSPSVVVHGWIWAGSIDVAPEKAGLASLTASMLTRGTANRSFTQIGEQVESVGAILNIGSSGHTTRFTVKCLVEDLPLLMDILTDCLYNSTFPTEYLERRRGQILTAIEQREDSTQAMATLIFNELMYPHHPYGISQLGYRETIANLTREDVVAFYRDHYGAHRMGVILVGALPCQKGLDVLEASLGGWSGVEHKQLPLPQVAPLDAIREKRAAISGKVQSDLFLGWPGMKRTDLDFHKALLANSVLGEYGMMGRIGRQVRDERGLAYYVSTTLDAGIGAGPWVALAGADPHNVECVIEGILAEVQRLRCELVDESELSDNKSCIIGSLPLRLESSEGIAAQIAEMEVYGLGLDYMQRFPSLIAELTAEDLMDVARTYLSPDVYVLSIAGPPDVVK